MSKAVERRMTLKDQVTPGLKKISNSTLAYKKSLKDLKAVANDTWGNVREGISSIAAPVAGVISSILGISAALSTLKTGVNVASDLESYRLTLETVMKDTKKAGELMKWASGFANITPFETTEVIEGTVRLQAYGIEAQKTMTSIGDMAAVMNKDLMQAIEAVADAQTGELERLKEFSITKAMIEKKAGEMFRNQTVINNKGMIVDQQKFNDALFALMDERFKGGMDKQSKTFKGLMSTITGTWRTGLAEIMGVQTTGDIRKGSVFDKLKTSAESFAASITQLSENGTFQKWGENLSNIIDGTVNVYNTIKNNWSNISPIVYGVVGSLVAYKAAVILANAWTVIKTSSLKLAVQWQTFYGNTAAATAGKVGILTLAQQGLNSAMRANPILFVVSLLGVLVTAGLYVKNNWEQIKLTGMETWNTIVDSTEWAVNRFIDFANYMQQIFIPIFNNVKIAGMSIWNDIVSAAETGIQGLMTPLNSIRKGLGQEEIKVDFSGAKFKNIKSTMSNSFVPLDYVNFSGGKFGEDAIMAQMKRAQEEKTKKQTNDMDKLIAAIDKNTTATDGNTNSTNSNTSATDKNSSAIAKSSRDMTAEQIADKLMPRLERQIYST